MADLYRDTPAGALQAALGLGQPDVTAAEARAEEIKAELERDRRARFERIDFVDAETGEVRRAGPWEMSLDAARVVALAEQRASEVAFDGDAAELARRLQGRFWPVAVLPDPAVEDARADLARQVAGLAP